MEKIRIRDPGWKKVGIRDKDPGSATLPLKKHIKNKGKSTDNALLQGYLVSNEVW
jgi:hypothetical protein